MRKHHARFGGGPSEKGQQWHLAGGLPDGEVDGDDRQENELSVREGLRVFSAYRTRLSEKLWVITVRPDTRYRIAARSS